MALLLSHGIFLCPSPTTLSLSSGQGWWGEKHHPPRASDLLQGWGQSHEALPGPCHPNMGPFQSKQTVSTSCAEDEPRTKVLPSATQPQPEPHGAAGTGLLQSCTSWGHSLASEI